MKHFVSKHKLYLLIILSSITGGSIPVFAKFGLEVFGPFTVIFLRFFFATLVLLPFAARLGGLKFSVARGQLGVALVGSLNPIILFIGLQFSKASVTPMLYAAIPAMTALYIWIVRKEKIRASQILGISIGFAGVALIALLPLVEAGGVPVQELGGNVIMFGAVIAFFIYVLLSKRSYERDHISPIVLTFYFCVVTLILSVPFALREALLRPEMWPSARPEHVLAGVVIGVFGTSLGYIAYQNALKLGSEMSVAVVMYLQPVVTVICAWVILGERLTVPFIIGGAMALVGAQIASGTRMKRSSQQNLAQ